MNVYANCVLNVSYEGLMMVTSCTDCCGIHHQICGTGTGCCGELTEKCQHVYIEMLGRIACLVHHLLSNAAGRG